MRVVRGGWELIGVVEVDRSRWEWLGVDESWQDWIGIDGSWQDWMGVNGSWLDWMGVDGSCQKLMGVGRSGSEQGLIQIVYDRVFQFLYIDKKKNTVMRKVQLSGFFLQKKSEQKEVYMIKFSVCRLNDK